MWTGWPFSSQRHSVPGAISRPHFAHALGSGRADRGEVSLREDRAAHTTPPMRLDMRR
jgi:hypothetical protein